VPDSLDAGYARSLLCFILLLALCCVYKLALSLSLSLFVT